MKGKRFIGFLSGLGATIHHKIVAGVWISSNQSWLRCHGKLGILFMSINLFIILLKPQRW